ncbi:hypothetical protein JTE90_025622 [Oedothorax gibbosus]|uniref:Ribosome biogenesis protein NOP53 n=1 Tax=Oedothorax gibbosus TaxID=931172 RepID=A0AAV6VAM6_9ARAC|nr:hypothetical protein JTE90_025622 [Oedothorax gibbosus]
MVMGSVQKKKRVRVSKNRKRNWNKHCDVKEIEDFLEDKRFDERIGGAVSEKSDNELFSIETDAKTESENKSQSKKLKCFQSIGAYTKVPPLHQRDLKPYSKRINNVITKADKRRWKSKLENATQKKEEVKKNIQLGDMFYAELKDLWADEKNEADPEIKDLITFRDEYTCKRMPNVPAHRFQKPSLLPAVEIPHSGASYNPDFDDHQNLLREAVEIEEKKLKEELHLKRVLTDMFPTKSEAPTQESVLEEMSQGLFEEPSDEEEQEEGSNTLYSRNPPVSYEDRLPKARRRRKKERKEMERLRLVKKLEKKRQNEVFRIKTFKRQIAQEAEDTQKKVERNIQRKVDKMYKPKTLSAHKYEAPDLEVNLSEEISGSLRTLKTEGNLMEDRYKSLQRRNLIEPRIIQRRKRKYKLKVQVKRSHRE